VSDTLVEPLELQGDYSLAQVVKDRRVTVGMIGRMDLAHRLLEELLTLGRTMAPQELRHPTSLDQHRVGELLIDHLHEPLLGCALRSETILHVRRENCNILCYRAAVAHKMQARL
jgi:hypothetical protein